MIGIELVRDRGSKEPAPSTLLRVQEEAKHRGLIVGRGGLYANTIRLCPPLIISRADVDSAIGILDEAFAAAAAAGDIAS
jgi:4-aminobutyrate aminotransferase-like enzyme